MSVARTVGCAIVTAWVAVCAGLAAQDRCPHRVPSLRKERVELVLSEDCADRVCPVSKIYFPQRHSWRTRPGSFSDVTVVGQVPIVEIRARCALVFLLGVIPVGSRCVPDGSLILGGLPDHGPVVCSTARE